MDMDNTEICDILSKHFNFKFVLEELVSQSKMPEFLLNYEKSRQTTVQKFLRMISDDRNIENRLLQLCKNLKITSHLPIQQHKEDIEEKLNTGGNFVQIIISLLNKKIITIYEYNELMEIKESDPNLSKSKVLKILSKIPIIIVRKLMTRFKFSITHGLLSFRN